MVRATHAKKEPTHFLDGGGRFFMLSGGALPLVTSTSLTGSAVPACCWGVRSALGGEDAWVGGIKGFYVGFGLKGMWIPSFGKFLLVTSSIMNMR
jgi:hypothetical protein